MSLGLPVLTATDDLKDFFNQLKLAPQEYWKQNLLWCDLLAHASNEGIQRGPEHI